MKKIRYIIYNFEDCGEHQRAELGCAEFKTNRVVKSIKEHMPLKRVLMQFYNLQVMNL